MFSRLKQMISAAPSGTPQKREKERRALYVPLLGEPEFVFRGDDEAGTVIEAYARDFAPDGTIEKGYVLLTNGMSDRRMTIPEEVLGTGVKPRTELMWYVRAPTPEIIANLRWLAQFPFLDNRFLAFGHRIPMPTPPLSGCAFRTFLLLTPIIRTDQLVSRALDSGRERVDILTVNLISDAEYAFIQKEGVDRFLDVLDEREYPVIFDPRRRSYL